MDVLYEHASEILKNPHAVVLWLFVVSLANYRLSLMTTSEEGALGVFDKLRKYAGVVSVPVMHEVDTVETVDGVQLPTVKEYIVLENLPTYLQPTKLSRGATCLHCTSFWFALFFTFASVFFPLMVFALSIPFSLSALAILFNKVGS